MYESVTDWQSEDFLIRIVYGVFDMAEEAESFGSQAKRLKLIDGALEMSTPMEGTAPVNLNDDNLELFKLKDDVKKDLLQSQRPVTIEDYEPMDIPISDFSKHRELKSFGSLSFGSRLISRFVHE